MEFKPSVTVIIPTYNGAHRIARCLDQLCAQLAGRRAEIIVVDDGSYDNIADVICGYPSVRLVSQSNAGPAAARNRGAREASGEIILFTDDDCEPDQEWFDSMLEPFSDPEVVGVKGAYRTRQKRLMARFVQAEYEDRYRYMARTPDIDFIDTYSAAFRRDCFWEAGGYDTNFPVACAEDVDLSYRMSAKGWKMRFQPKALVYHQHPDSLISYLKKKFKFAYWRVLAVRKNPGKAIKDSHTPQLMKMQLLFGPAVIAALGFDLIARPPIPATLLAFSAFFLTTVPFALRNIPNDPKVGVISPLVLAGRSCAQLAGIVLGTFRAAPAQRGGNVRARIEPRPANETPAIFAANHPEGD